MIAAYLWAQMEEAEAITRRRLVMWDTYHRELEALEAQGLLRRPVIPEACRHNAHMYYILLPSAEKRSLLMDYLRSKGINTVFHYVPLHSSEMGSMHGRPAGSLDQTTDLAARLLRLPLWLGMEEHMDEVIQEIRSGLSRTR
jgi:dTDP-4-amino-4,6-dideoxygalactose transaminase